MRKIKVITKRDYFLFYLQGRKIYSLRYECYYALYFNLFFKILIYEM